VGLQPAESTPLVGLQAAESTPLVGLQPAESTPFILRRTVQQNCAMQRSAFRLAPSDVYIAVPLPVHCSNCPNSWSSTGACPSRSLSSMCAGSAVANGNHCRYFVRHPCRYFVTAPFAVISYRHPWLAFASVVRGCDRCGCRRCLSSFTAMRLCAHRLLTGSPFATVRCGVCMHVCLESRRQWLRRTL
jgi:hypothetical protein